MPRILLALVMLTALSGCASDHKLALCKGPLVALNSSQWRPSDTELAQLAAVCPEDK